MAQTSRKRAKDARKKELRARNARIVAGMGNAIAPPAPPADPVATLNRAVDIVGRTIKEQIAKLPLSYKRELLVNLRTWSASQVDVIDKLTVQHNARAAAPPAGAFGKGCRTSDAEPAAAERTVLVITD